MSAKVTYGDESLEKWTRLNRGGFGYVFSAKHKELKREVAIKLLHDDDGCDISYSSLVREARYMESAAHQFVPKVYGMYWGCPPGLISGMRHGIIMELMERGSLKSLQQVMSNPPPWPLAFRLAHQVAQAMNYLHSMPKPLVHMDLTPNNVLLDTEFNAKIADFGLSTVSASVLDNSEQFHFGGGTLAYIPPEAFERKYSCVRSYDIYSYGILLWTILTGEEPYPGVLKAIVTFKVAMGHRPDLDKIDQQKADGLDKLVDLMKKCWDKDCTKRPKFKECTEVTGPVFSRHEEGIDTAVDEFSTELVKKQHGREKFNNENLENWKKIGKGGFGEVFMAKHKHLNIEVAIKLLHDCSGTCYALGTEADYMDAAAQEFVPRVYGMYMGCPPGLGSAERLGIVMELMERGSLKSLQQALAKPPPWPLAFRLAHQVAKAMIFLHIKELVHMDLKPDNVLLDANFNAKIADFSLCTISASFRGSVLKTSDKDSNAGTIAYMPPEAFDPEYRGRRAFDIYSYGILLWTILTGMEPYPYPPEYDEDLLELRISEGDRPDLTEIDAKKAEGLQELVELMQMCWDQDPIKRPNFGACIEVTGPVFSRHEKKIDIAVYETFSRLSHKQPGKETFDDESLENWKRLNRGCFGQVFRAKRKDSDKEVAIKLLHCGFEGPGILYSALVREADYMESAAHQYVPKFYGMYWGIPPCLGRRQGIVMELMERGSLQSIQQVMPKPPPWPLAFRLAHEVAQAMNYLHSKQVPIVHMDLKPGNVLLDANFNAKISDFGLSTLSISVLKTSGKGNRGGTLSYIPPEAFELNYTCRRSYDLYSYGILLWSILTGMEPYQGAGRDIVAVRVAKGHRPDLDKIDQKKAGGLDKLVDLMKKCWDQDCTKRPKFEKCTEVTGPVFSRHEEGIDTAVNEFLTELVKKQHDGEFNNENLENWKRIGKGAFGEVVTAKHKHLNIEVAIKLLHDNSGTCYALGTEADYMDAAAQEFVPKVYGMYMGCPPGLGFAERQGIVMELMERGSLKSLQQALLSTPPPWPLAFRLAHQVAQAMNFLHSKKVPLVHMDLKPDNVLLDAKFNAKIADFGLCTISASTIGGDLKSDKDSNAGTIAYMPPEAFDPEYSRSRAFDIYSYGILLWTILTGMEPYPPGYDEDLLELRISEGDRPDLTEIDAKKAEGLQELVELMQMCWDQDPFERPKFKECIGVTGPVFARHEKNIDIAVDNLTTEMLTNLVGTHSS